MLMCDDPGFIPLIIFFMILIGFVGFAGGTIVGIDKERERNERRKGF